MWNDERRDYLTRAKEFLPFLRREGASMMRDSSLVLSLVPFWLMAPDFSSWRAADLLGARLV